MSTPVVSARALGLGALVAAAVGLGCWMGLSALATPSDFTARSAAVEAKVLRAQALVRPAIGGETAGAQAVCPSLSQTDVAALGASLAASAQQAKVTVTDLVTAPAVDLSGRGRLAPVALRLQGEGPYEAVVAWIEALAQNQPAVFVETLDLKPRSPVVGLKLTGKVYCWTSVRR